MARSGLSTRTVRMADRLALCPSKEYSITLQTYRRNQSDISGALEAMTETLGNTKIGFVTATLTLTLALERSNSDTDAVLFCKEMSHPTSSLERLKKHLLQNRSCPCLNLQNIVDFLQSPWQKELCLFLCQSISLSVCILRCCWVLLMFFRTFTGNVNCGFSWFHIKL